MPDQASILRGLMERHVRAANRRSAPVLRSGPRSLVVTSGKGGVGKTHIALNTAIQIARSGRSVCLLDANPGPGSLELLCGLNGYWNLTHVLSGSRSVADVAQVGPYDLRILTGVVDLLDSPIRSSSAAKCQAWALVLEYLQPFQFLIIDAASGNQLQTRQLMHAADGTWLVMTPELTAIADAYSLVKGLAAEGPLPRIELLVNRAANATQARDIVERMQQTVRGFLQQEIDHAGFVPHDICVSQAVTQRLPFVQGAPQSAATAAIEQLAKQWRDRVSTAGSTFTQRFTQQQSRAA